MSQILRLPLNIRNGFYPSSAAVGGNRIPDSLIDGSNMLFLGPGLMRSAKGLGAGPVGDADERIYNLNGRIGSVNGKGSIIPFRGGSEWYVSVSTAANAIKGVVSHTGTGGRIRYYTAAGMERNVGLSAPTLPANSLTATIDGTMSSGATRAIITRIRTAGFIDGSSSTNIYAESNGSDPSNSVSFENKLLTLQFPVAVASDSLDYHDAWGVYFTDADQGNTGDFRMFKTVITESMIPGDRIVRFEFKDGDKLSLNPPVDNDPPPLCQFLANLGGVMIALGTEGGTRFHTSKQGFSEAFPPLSAQSLSPAEAVQGFTARPVEGELIYWTMSSIGALQLTGSPDFPVQCRSILSDQGAQAPHGICYGYSRIYGINGPSGPFSLSVNGDPETSFALPVRDFIRDMGIDPAKCAVGYDPMSASVVYCLGGDTALVFHEGLSQAMGQPIWSVPITLNLNTGAFFTSTLTFEGKLIIGRVNGGGSGLGAWETGAVANPDWFIVTTRQDAPEPMDKKTLTGFRFSCNTPTNATVTAKLFLDFEDTTSGTPAATQTSTGTGRRYSKWKRINKPCKNYALRIEGTNSDERIEDMQFEMIYTPGIREKG